MALIESIVIPLGTQMPDFQIEDPYGKEYNSKNLYGDRGLLVAFSCNHCPYALAVWPRLIKIAEYAKKMHVNTVVINPNINPDYPQDAPDKMREKIEEWGLKFPYLIDETQEVAKSFKAQCTPDIFLFDGRQKLIYHGRVDDNWEDESKVTREELKEALNNHAVGLPISKDQKPTLGCSIKWR